MKRTVAILLALLLTLTMPACAANAPSAAEATAASMMVVAAVEETAFSDVPDSAWYAKAVRYVSERGLMNGTGEGKFSPDEPFTRAQLATVLYRMAGSPPVTGEDSFTDTEAGAWYSDAVLWASRSGVVNGLGGGRYGTNEPTTQEQLAVMLWRDAGSYVLGGEYADARGVENHASDWAVDAVRWARVDGLLTDAIPFEPRSAATRAQVADMVYRYLLLLERFADVDAVSGATQKHETENIVLTVAGKTLAVEWADNSSVDALRELLRRVGTITLDMSDYAGFEKGAPLPETLPQNNEPMNTDAGDIILYQGRQFVIYYDRNSYSLTPLGKITGMAKAELQALVGAGNVTATLSLSGAAEPTTAANRTLVVYFSATGTTKSVAERLASVTGSDLCEIVPTEPYTAEDLNYNDSSTRATREQNDASARPAISGTVANMAYYDIIFLGYPIWWGQAPKIMYTFVESYDLAGKTVVPFCTSGSSDIGSSAVNLSKSAPGAVWIDGKRFSGGVSDADLQAWITTLK